MTAKPHVNIVIPTFNRQDLVAPAVEAALGQDYDNFSVTVVDDGSQDETWRACQTYSGEERFQAIRLGRNAGTAQAKNIAIALTQYDAITFHDSDDIPKVNKLSLQVAALESEHPIADPMMDWAMVGQESGKRMTIDVVVGAYDFVKQDGQCYRIANRISLVDDFFPHLQFPSQVEGDWCLINAGLFRRSCFAKRGGYLNSIEEDRELRNRLLGYGHIFSFVNEPLLTKYEMADSLTVAPQTSFQSVQRQRDRAVVQERKIQILRKFAGDQDTLNQMTPIDLRDIEIADFIGLHRFAVQTDIPIRGFFKRAKKSNRLRA